MYGILLETSDARRGPMRNDVKIGVIGGSGLYGLDGMKNLQELHVPTPFGDPSDAITVGELDGRAIAFLPRHGRGHFLNPSEVPSRANIAALKLLGVEEIVSFSAVGSLREEIPPRDFVLPSQLFDRTKGVRPSTFFEGGAVAHATFADPFAPYLADLIFQHSSVLQGAKMHKEKTLVVMEGPAFSTRAESNFYRSIGGDVINMSALPEAKLARELEISYQMVCMSTDYDCWKVEEEAVTVETVIANLNMNADNAKRLLGAVLPHMKGESPLKGSMKNAIITAPGHRGEAAKKRLEALLPGYL